MKKMLKPGGQVVHIDFQKRELPVGPPLAMKIAREDLVKQMEGAGFRLDRRAHLPAVPVLPGLHASGGCGGRLGAPHAVRTASLP